LTTPTPRHTTFDAHRADVTGLTCGTTQATLVHASDIESQQSLDDRSTMKRQHTVRSLAFEFNDLASA
jgi:hypothetical protein